MLAGVISIHSDEGGYVIKLSEKPCVSGLVRYLAQSKTHVPNQRHDTIHLNFLQRTVIQYFDGEQTIEQIIEKMCEHIYKGDIDLLDDDEKKMTDKEEIKERMISLVYEMTDIFLNNALFVS